MKRTLLLTITLLLAITMSAQQKYVGGDLSLVPAYEAAGDVWLDAKGNKINTEYDGGMITYVKEVAKWNAVRVRLLVDPTQDDAPATCQDLEYVKALGKRIKDAGMSFLLDIFYSDTWTDVSKQWIPTSWGYNKSTATETLAAKVKSYTTEVLNALVSNGATPDFVQIGNEVSYGMLWDTMSGSSRDKWFITSGTYNNQKANIERFAALLKAASEGVRASNCSSAKIVLHCERTKTATYVKNFYDWVEKAGFTDYDIIGLSYYPVWHGNLDALKATLTTIKDSYPSKKVHIVETGYFNSDKTLTSSDTDTRSTWAFTPEGQASFLKDLINVLNEYNNVTGLYYWQPEECGNGADEGGTNRVMGSWDQRGFWELTWKSGQHRLISEKALMTLNTFNRGSGYVESEETDITGQFLNMGFETGDGTGWIINYEGWKNGPFPKAKDQWQSSLTSDNYVLQGWSDSPSTLPTDANLISQTLDNLPAGTYTVTAIVHTDLDGVLLFANNDTKSITATTDWGTAYQVSVTTTLSTTGSLTIGLKFNNPTPTKSDEANIYVDNFTCTQQTTGIADIRLETTADSHYYSLDGRQLNGKPTQKGIYINGGRKVIVK